ncbi:MAG: ribosome biogenesis GTP-binding protein YihA/YsxC, partial [Halanaerobiales bacterium]
KLAHTSSTPGRTQCINFYNIGDRLFFVDFPGYGFARVPDDVRQECGELINHYLYNRRNLYGVIQIIDVRHEPTDDDQMMVEWLKEAGLPFIVAATKLDKISRSRHKQRYQSILKSLELKENDLVLFSVKSGRGKGEVLSFIERELD